MTYGNIKIKKILNDFSKLDKKALRFNNNLKIKLIIKYLQQII